MLSMQIGDFDQNCFFRGMMVVPATQGDLNRSLGIFDHLAISKIFEDLELRFLPL